MVVQNAWDDRLRQHTVTFVVDDAGGEIVEALDVESHNESEPA